MNNNQNELATRILKAIRKAQRRGLQARYIETEFQIAVDVSKDGCTLLVATVPLYRLDAEACIDLVNQINVAGRGTKSDSIAEMNKAINDFSAALSKVSRMTDPEKMRKYIVNSPKERALGSFDFSPRRPK